MLDDNDIKKIIKAQKEVFVTKEEFEGLIDIVATKQEFGVLDNKISGLDDKISGVEKMLKSMDEKLDNLSEVGKRVDYIEGVMNIPALHAKEI